MEELRKFAAEGEAPAGHRETGGANPVAVTPGVTGGMVKETH